MCLRPLTGISASLTLSIDLDSDGATARLRPLTGISASLTRWLADGHANHAIGLRPLTGISASLTAFCLAPYRLCLNNSSSVYVGDKIA